MTFQNYPLAMKHPQYRPAVISHDRIENGTLIKMPPGSPVRFPPVFVHNEEQEKQYAALGYLPGGVSDPEEYHRAMTGNIEPADHAHHEYPRWMYQPDESGDVNVTVGYDIVRVRGVLVDSEKERKQLRGDWFETPAEAAKSAPVEEDEQAEHGEPAEKKRVGRPPSADKKIA